ncbi:universal stress protein [Psychrosphaera sp. B3R10]|uniref:universal stress protein n=1 Tax=unclassified Psychrosphaera TaxID=2641570 RepID=UPI001C091993|nr:MULTISPECIES: universal stress protein [unclassified Psychrosphaera]MBU2883472.1 universal stress protein [Psychrosphaera sp. I2R16]MBU2990328.1 universal stress protein [Psychrosphaera sp. B3R10]
MEKIITCIDGSAITTSVVNAGTWAAKKLDKTLTFLHTLEKKQQHGADDYSGAIGLGAQSKLLKEMTELDEQKSRLAVKLGDELLNSAAMAARSSGVVNIEKAQRHGDIVDAIMSLEDQTRLIVIGRKGAEHEGDFKALGSHLETLLRKASDPVFVVPEQFVEPKSFMIAYDGRETADRALQKVIDGGLLHGIDCHLVSIKNNEPLLIDKFNSAAKRLKDKGLNVTTAVLEGNINETLLRYQVENAIDLVVMGAFGHSKLRQFFVGSNTIKMLERIAVPLIVLR